MASYEEDEKTFTAKGEALVRADLASGRYNPAREERARIWLAVQSGLRNEASQAEQSLIARSAKDAAWAAVREAKTANIMAMIASAIAALALIFSAISLVISIFHPFAASEQSQLNAPSAGIK